MDQQPAISHRNLLLTQRLVHLMEAFSSENITCLAIKGPALATQAYGDPALRSFADLDLLIHPADFPRVYTLMLQLGYRPALPLDPPRLRWWLRFDKEFSFQRSGATVEVHWALVDRGMQHPIPTSFFWQDPQPVDILGLPVLTLGPQKALWYACLHGAIHEWSQRKWVDDVAALSHILPDLDWDAFLDQAHAWDFSRLASTALLLAADPGGFGFPPPVLERISRDPYARTLAAEARARLAPDRLPYTIHRLQFIDHRVSASPPPRVSSSVRPQQANTLFFFRSRQRLGHRLLYLLDRLFTPRQADWLALRLPAALTPLYILLRPFRLLVVYGPGMVREMLRKISPQRAQRTQRTEN